jgi:N-acetylglucosaminyldiphosphoundecaprenol N-acetyl-beta-D-mannosaminyltransferase
MGMQPEFETYDVLGIPMSVTTLASAEAAIVRWAGDDVGRFVCVREVPSLMASIEDPALVALHREAAMVVPDGMPLVWIGKRRGLAVERTCGPDLMERLMASSPRTGLRHYLYGGKPGVAEALKARFTDRYPGLRIVGIESPPFRPATPAETAQTLDRIRASGADVVWIGVSSPKQDVWMHDNYRALSQTLIGVGAAFDFHAGAVRRAPRWMQKAGIEWLHRLAQEPRRLWRRYLILAPKFVWACAAQTRRKA